MEQQRKNKEFIIGYFNTLNSTPSPKSRALLEHYISDEHLIEHISFFEGVFPNYTVDADEITAEGNRVVVRARLKGLHKGDLNGIPPTYKEVDMPFAIGYEIENEKIVSHWLIADQMILMEQLGVMSAVS